MYGEELSKRLTSELSGNLERTVCDWMLDPARRDCWEYIAMQVKQVYHAQFKTHLEQSILALDSGDLTELLLAFLPKLRYEGPEVDRVRADHDAKTLYKAGEKKLGTDESKFIRIFSDSSTANLTAVSYAYHNTYGT